MARPKKNKVVAPLVVELPRKPKMTVTMEIGDGGGGCITTEGTDFTEAVVEWPDLIGGGGMSFQPTYGGFKIHTYFAPCDGIDYATELSLLLVWQKRWQELGYTTVALNPTQAEAHPLYAEYRRKVDTFPTINPREYDRACWLRWLALEMAGGGAMSDYDVFPRALTPAPLGPEFTIFENGVPSLASGTRKSVRKFIDYILSLPDGYAHPTMPGHFSDMIAVRDLPGLVTVPLCVQFGDLNWLTAPFVHCSHASMHPAGKSPRWKFVEAVMNMKEAA